MDILNNDFLPDGGWIARYVKNAFGIDESVRLPRSHWKHFDWLASIGTDMDQFTMQCDVNRHINQPYMVSFSGYICEMLVKDEARRHRAGEEVPLHINPDRPISLEKTPPHEEAVVRDVANALGETVPLVLKRGSWKYLDWLGRQGTNVDQFIIDADHLRHEPKWKGRTLTGMLELLLREDEKKRYFSNEPSPL
ncbi:MAG: hypothetical protein KJ731_08410, partial [Alphaproteobacteria bacterium]|nr:hypothetical protein [Alphaproteobacteria bacterium]